MRSLLLTVLLPLLAHHAAAMIPKECAHNVTTAHGVCCPENPHNGKVCGGPHMGWCQKITVPTEKIPAVFAIDDRVHWPLRFFKYACQCKGNFYGPSCNECWYGWKGKNCDIREKRVRRDIRSLSKHELHVFHDVVRRANTWPTGYVVLDESTSRRSDPLHQPQFQDASVQFYLAFLHRYGSRTTMYKNEKDCELYGVLEFNHDGCVFPTWHRYFLLKWERWLGQIAEKYHGVKNFAVPYWDWVGLDKCDICNDKYIGGEGETDQFGVRISKAHPWRDLSEYCSEPRDGAVCYGCQYSGIIGKLTRTFNSVDFPNQKDFDFVMKLKHYFVPGERNDPNCKSFHMALEGYCGPNGISGENLWTHNKFHNLIDGSMCCGSTATNDPLFILHHALIDKIFSMWYKMHKPSLKQFPQEGVRPGHCRDCFLVGFVPPVRNSDMFIPHENLGYTYDDAVLGRAAKNDYGPFKYVI